MEGITFLKVGLSWGQRGRLETRRAVSFVALSGASETLHHEISEHLVLLLWRGRVLQEMIEQLVIYFRLEGVCCDGTGVCVISVFHAWRLPSRMIANLSVSAPRTARASYPER